MLFFILLYIGATVIALLCLHRTVRRNRLLNHQAHVSQEQQMEQLISFIDQRLHTLEEDLTVLQQMLQEMPESQMVQPFTPSDSQPGVDWLALINNAIKGDREKLHQQIMQTEDAHIIDFADPYKHLNNHAYAEFSDHSSGGCLLVPHPDLPSRYFVFPLPNGGDWLSQHHDLLNTIFLMRGDPGTRSVTPQLHTPAVVSRKSSQAGTEQAIYGIVQKGVMMC